MKIFIPTRERAERQLTAAYFLEIGFDVTYVVTRGDEPYPDGDLLIVDADRIGPTRQAIIDSHDGPMMMLDDDLKFKRRLGEGSGKTRPCTPEDFQQLMLKIKDDLHHYDLIGIADRYLINLQPWPCYTWNKQLHIFAFDTRWVKRKGIRFDRCHVGEDVDFTLQILRAGGRQMVRTDYCIEDARHFGPGGCSTWRTNEVHNEGMKQFRDLWPGIVTLKPTLHKGRHKPIVQWKKLREATS